MRVYVVGGPGSGKTKLALEVSRRLAAPLLQLDEVWVRVFERDAEGHITDAARRFREELVADYAGREAWVIEGAEPPFLERVATVCDLIVWCDISFAVAAARMIRRHLVADLRGDNRYPGYRRLYRFLRSVRRGYTATAEASDKPWTKWTRASVADSARSYEAKMVTIRSGSVEKNVGRVLRRIGP